MANISYSFIKRCELPAYILFPVGTTYAKDIRSLANTSYKEFFSRNRLLIDILNRDLGT